jgi:hypothetical protein
VVQALAGWTRWTQGTHDFPAAWSWLDEIGDAEMQARTRQQLATAWRRIAPADANAAVNGHPSIDAATKQQLLSDEK